MVLAVIPARYASVRLPGKALADIGGVPMIVRVWEQVRRASSIDEVLIATDDLRIAEVARSAGAAVVMTGPCASGTDRVAEAVRGRAASVVVNVQGDEPFIDPDDIARVAGAVSNDAAIVTAGCALFDAADDPARVKVVCDSAGRALYFSRSAIPHGGPWTLHVGIYAFLPRVIQELTALPSSPLERGERLEQLRWLEAGYRVRVVPVRGASLSVDTPVDLERARAHVRSASGSSP